MSIICHIFIADQINGHEEVAFIVGSNEKRLFETQNVVDVQ